MTDSDSTKVIEKLTEVLELLKAPKKEQAKEKEKEQEKEQEKEVKICTEKCPLRKAMSEKEFSEMMKSMEKVDAVKLYRSCVECEDCSECPFKKERFDLQDEIVEEPCTKGQCVQLLNALLTVILLVLFFVLLIRTIKGFYCTV